MKKFDHWATKFKICPQDWASPEEIMAIQEDAFEAGVKAADARVHALRSRQEDGPFINGIYAAEDAVLGTKFPRK